MVSQRENRINELLEWAKKNNLKKSIPENWKSGLAGTIMKVTEWGRIAGPIIHEAQMRYKVTYQTAEDYASLVIDLLIQSTSQKAKA